jgi:drug/metabolite transporter (DMT)-like permease
VHAGWNGLVASATDTHAMTALALVAGVVVLVPFALLVGWDVDGAALPYIAGSAVLELVYYTLLATAYAGAGLTAVYPIARGSAPVFALIVSVAFLAAPVSGLQAAGVVVVAAGVVAVRGLRRPAGRLLWLALSIGVCIAGYTLTDDHGLHHASPVPYFLCVLALSAAGFWAGMAARGKLPAVRATLGWQPVVAGVGMVAAYLLTLAALERAEAAPVAALRETSVVMATAAAALWGREHVSGARIAGALAVVAGVAAIALG